MLTIGPAGAFDAIRKALQMGADKGVHICDDAIAGSDALATSLALAKAVEKAGSESSVDLVLCGMASTDAAMSVVLPWGPRAPPSTLASSVISMSS